MDPNLHRTSWLEVFPEDVLKQSSNGIKDVVLVTSVVEEREGRLGERISWDKVRSHYMGYEGHDFTTTELKKRFQTITTNLTMELEQMVTAERLTISKEARGPQ